MLFSFNRETGEPLFPDRGTPGADGHGYRRARSCRRRSRIRSKPPVLVRNSITPDDAWGFTVFDRNACRKKIEEMRHGSHYEPIMTRGTVLFPQPGGGANWGGGAFDPQRNLLVTPVSQIPYYVKLLPKAEVDPEYAKRPGGRRADAGARLHRRHALRREAGAADVAVVLAVHGAALGTAGRRGHGEGRDPVEGALRRARQADAGARSR